MQLKVLLGVIFIFGASMLFAQSSREVGPPKPPAPAYKQTKKTQKGLIAKIFKKKELTPAEAFDARMKAAVKQDKKEAKMAKKPQYSNPLYFGHKKPPKKRPLDKRKLCKHCNIVH